MPTFANPDSTYRGTTGTVVPASWTDLVNDDLNALYGDASWTLLTLGASLTATGSGFRSPSMMLGGGKFVYLSGVATASALIAAGATIATLPAGYRPPFTVVTTYMNASTAVPGEMRITSGGTVTLSVSTIASGNSISFDATPPFATI